MTTSSAPPPSTLLQTRATSIAAVHAFAALLLRDAIVLRKNFRAFILRTVMQPLMTVFVFAYVFPKIGQGIGGSGQSQSSFATLLVPGVMATACIFQGIQSVALPLVQEFGFTGEIEDRVLAPLPVSGVAIAKIAAGAIQAMIAALVVFPLARFVPASAVHLTFDWPVLLTVGPLACVAAACLGLTIGTRAAPQQVALVFSVIVLPMTFLGATYYPWASLSAIPWLKVAVLVNPLVYMSEGLRHALTSVPGMPLLGIYAALLTAIGVLGYLGISGFRRRVLS